MSPTSTDVSSSPAQQRQSRKRIQNRVNQRNLRLRRREDCTEGVVATSKPFQIDSWRLDEHAFYHVAVKPRQAKATACFNDSFKCGSRFEETNTSPQDSELVSKSVRHLYAQAPRFPADNLLHLIHYNVFRAVYYNKRMLNQLSVALIPGSDQRVPLMSDEAFHGSFTLQPIASDIPDCLAPTQLQQSVVHSTWINMLPFPKMRDMLIQWEASFDHRDFAEDVLGTLILGSEWFKGRRSQNEPPEAQRWLLPSLVDEDEITAQRKGLIVWGEPHLPGSWEASPAFLRKWAWAVAECEELIRSSNRWREIRGEEAMRLEEYNCP